MTERAQLRALTPMQSGRADQMLQRKCDCGTHSVGGGECDTCRKKKARLQYKLSVGAADDVYEREADRVAEEVTARDGVAASSPAPVQVRRFANTDEAASPDVPASVDQVLASSGQPLERGLRDDMEQRFRRDFSTVRVHTDPLAQQSARDVNAHAYTVGGNIVFGAGKFQPWSYAGKQLLAHELAHTLQQRGDPTTLQRACLSAAECGKKRATLTDFVANTEKEPANVSKKAKRDAACKKSPPDKSCTSDGHGAKATALTTLLNQNYKSRLTHVDGVFVNKDIPGKYGAVTYTKDSGGCAAFLPSLHGDNCTTVPDQLEAEAKLYLKGDAIIGGQTRANWLADTVATLTHETEHARFEAQPAITAPSATACAFADLKSNLSELAADLSEMHVQYRAAIAKPEAIRFQRLEALFSGWVNNPFESIAGILTELRCKCECKDADHYIVKTSVSVSNSQKWDSYELKMLHTELQKPKWNLKWPVSPPASFNATDLPNTTPAPFKLE
jgi:Domain of unknown function (DUF4157)